MCLCREPPACEHLRTSQALPETCSRAPEACKLRWHFECTGNSGDDDLFTEFSRVSHRIRVTSKSGSVWDPVYQATETTPGTTLLFRAHRNFKVLVDGRLTCVLAAEQTRFFSTGPASQQGAWHWQYLVATSICPCRHPRITFFDWHITLEDEESVVLSSPERQLPPVGVDYSNESVVQYREAISTCIRAEESRHHYGIASLSPAP